MLTKREEISRLLAGMLANPAIVQADGVGLVGLSAEVLYAEARQFALIIAKLAEPEPQPEPAGRPSWDDAPESAVCQVFDEDLGWIWYSVEPIPRPGLIVESRPIAKAGA